jgi:anti-sigma B factor antagonist/stage II sporulation protein AA (anti-sigma F factor antagonist)
VLDLGAVDYIASVGLRVLMLASRQVRAQGGTIVVAALQPLVREIFEISKFTLVFACFATVADALADLLTRPRPSATSR